MERTTHIIGLLVRKYLDSIVLEQSSTWVCTVASFTHVITLVFTLPQVSICTVSSIGNTTKLKKNNAHALCLIHVALLKQLASDVRAQVLKTSFLLA